ncbi:hypothetical protein WN943_021260 [Citrus x changshan-huyou]
MSCLYCTDSIQVVSCAMSSAFAHLPTFPPSKKSLQAFLKVKVWTSRHRIALDVSEQKCASLLDVHVFMKHVWAGGFGAAILKKRSSSAYSTVEDGKINGLEGQVSVSMMQDKEPDIIETMLLSLLEKLFSYIINLPDVNQRIKKVVSAVTNNPPACPHLYLYSTGDKVIPYQSVELLIEEQRKTGRKVFSVIFGPSAHVDHFRTFPSRYLSELHNFLKECFATVKKT